MFPNIYIYIYRPHILLCAMLAYALVCAAFGLPTTWYETCLCFPLGFICSQKKERLGSVLFSGKVRFWVSLTMLSAAFVITLFLGNKPILADPFRIPVKAVSAVIFSLLILPVCANIKCIRNPVTSFLGKRSLEIYLLQGIFLNLFRMQLPIDHDWLYMLAVAAATLIASVLLHPVYQRILHI